MSSIFAQAGLTRVTLRHIGLGKLVDLCQTLGYSDRRTQRAADTFDLLSPHLAGAEFQREPPWPSDITDDGTPFEFSIAFHEGETDLRLLVEPQAPPTTLHSNWAAGLGVNRELVAAAGADDSAFRAVHDLFAPGDCTDAHFALWHAAVIEEDGTRLFKLYVNPRIHGESRANELVERAFVQLGYGAAWQQFLASRLAEPGASVRYLSLDLLPSSVARLKVYVAQEGSAERIAGLSTGASNLRPGDVQSWIAALANRSDRFDQRPILTCFSFSACSPVPAATIHVPVRCYLDNDADAAARVAAFLSEREVATFERVLKSLARTPLRDSRGLITYASLRREKSGAIRVTLYLAPQIYSTTRRPSLKSGY